MAVAQIARNVDQAESSLLEVPLEELAGGGAEGAPQWRSSAAQEGLRSSSSASPSAGASLLDGDPAPRAHRLA